MPARASRLPGARASVRRNGPPEAVSRMRRTPGALQVTVETRREATAEWRCARCRSAAARRRCSRRASRNRRPAMTSASLLASSTRLPARAAARVGGQAGGPDDGRHHRIDLGQRGHLRQRIRAGQHFVSASRPHATAAASARRARGIPHALHSAGQTAALRQQAVVCAWAVSATTSKRSGCRADDVQRDWRRRSRWRQGWSGAGGTSVDAS